MPSEAPKYFLEIQSISQYTSDNFFNYENSGFQFVPRANLENTVVLVFIFLDIFKGARKLVGVAQPTKMYFMFWIEGGRFYSS